MSLPDSVSIVSLFSRELIDLPPSSSRPPVLQFANYHPINHSSYIKASCSLVPTRHSLTATTTTRSPVSIRYQRRIA